MNRKIKSFNQICTICHKLQNQNKKIVFVHGFFDILHAGHILFINEAKKQGDVLIVGVDHDDNAKILKGKGRPIFDHKTRMFIMANLMNIDYVFLVPSFKDLNEAQKLDMFVDIYKKIKPDLIATALKAGINSGNIKKWAEIAGINTCDIDHGVYDISTTAIIEKIKNTP